MLYTTGYHSNIALIPSPWFSSTTKHITRHLIAHFQSDITIADIQGKTNALTRRAATLFHDSYQETDDGETENLVGNAARVVKDNIRTLAQPSDIYPSPEEVGIDRLEWQIPPLLLTLVKNTVDMGRTSSTQKEKHRLLLIAISHAIMGTVSHQCYISPLLLYPDTRQLDRRFC